MNLDAFVAPFTRVVNAPVTATIKVSTGSTTSANYVQVPTFASFPGVTVDVQALSGSDIKHLDAINIQGIMRAAYFNGILEGLDRPAGKGGDLIVFNGTTWLVTQVLEPWNENGWCKVAITLQNGS